MRGYVFWGLWVTAGAVVVVACTNDFDRYNFGEPEGGAGAVPVTVSAPSSSTSAGGATVTSSSTGAGECMMPDDCPGPPSDPTAPSGQCWQKNCVGGACLPIVPQIGTPCTDMGGQVCTGQGHCVECVDGSQCASMVCQNQICVMASCGDSILNGDETDVDCGGSCGACMNNFNCNGVTDCVSGFCDTSAGPCNMGTGGAGGGPSVAGCCQPCTLDTDCTGATWCDAGVCSPTKPDGDACGGGNECTSTFCTDGVCCNLACAANCMACNLSGTVGTCSPEPNGTICSDGLFCNGADTCNAGACSAHVGNPCPGHDLPIDCSDSCDESLDSCTANDASGTSCDENMDSINGTCDGAGVCVGD